MPLAHFEPRDYLRSQLAVLERWGDHPNAPPRSQTDVDGALGAVEALLRTSVIDPDEARLWHKRFAALSVDTRSSSSDRTFFRGDELLRVIRPEGLGSGSDFGFRLEAVDLYADGIGLRWVLGGQSRPGRPAGNFAPDPLDPRDGQRPVLQDDAGTQYVSAGGSASGVPLRGESLFVPAAPRGASQLFVDTTGHRVTVTL